MLGKLYSKEAVHLFEACNVGRLERVEVLGEVRPVESSEELRDVPTHCELGLGGPELALQLAAEAVSLGFARSEAPAGEAELVAVLKQEDVGAAVHLRASARLTGGFGRESAETCAPAPA